MENDFKAPRLTRSDSTAARFKSSTSKTPYIRSEPPNKKRCLDTQDSDDLLNTEEAFEESPLTVDVLQLLEQLLTIKGEFSKLLEKFKGCQCLR